MIKKFNDYIIEGITDHMKPKTDEEIKKVLDKYRNKPFKYLLKAIDNDFSNRNDNLYDYITEEVLIDYIEKEAYDIDSILDYCFRHEHQRPIEIILDNYKLYGKETFNSVNHFVFKIKNKELITFLLNNPQIKRLLTDDNLKIAEKFILNKNTSIVTKTEKECIKRLTGIIIKPGKDKNYLLGKMNGTQTYFNYHEPTKTLTFETDPLIEPVSSDFDISFNTVELIYMHIINDKFNLDAEKTVSWRSGWDGKDWGKDLEK